MKDIFDYDPLTGLIKWKVDVSSTARKGQEAGTKLDTGYRQIRYQGKTYKAHVLAWFLYYGKWPSELDHKNHIRDDNRLKNLREVTRSQNNHNTTRPNKTGLKGVRKTPKGRFQSMIRINGKNTYLGTFDTPEEAHDKYVEEAKRYFK